MKFFILLVLVCTILSSIAVTTASLTVDNESTLKEVRGFAFRKDSKTAWILLNYVDASTLHMSNGGMGSSDELMHFLKDDQIQYGLIRIPFGGSTRDVFFVSIGSAVSETEKGEKASNVEYAQAILKPFESSVTILSRTKLSDKNLKAAIDDGTNVVSEASTAGVLTLNNENELKEDRPQIFPKDAVDGWLIVDYVDATTLHYVTGQLDGNTHSLAPYLKDNKILYGIIRIPHNGSTVDVFFAFIGDEVGKYEKESKAHHRAEAEAFLRPFDASVTVNNYDKFDEKSLSAAITDGTFVIN